MIYCGVRVVQVSLNYPTQVGFKESTHLWNHLLADKTLKALLLRMKQLIVCGSPACEGTGALSRASQTVWRWLGGVSSTFAFSEERIWDLCCFISNVVFIKLNIFYVHLACRKTCSPFGGKHPAPLWSCRPERWRSRGTSAADLCCVQQRQPICGAQCTAKAPGAELSTSCIESMKRSIHPPILDGLLVCLQPCLAVLMLTSGVQSWTAWLAGRPWARRPRARSWTKPCWEWQNVYWKAWMPVELLLLQ